MLRKLTCVVIGSMIVSILAGCSGSPEVPVSDRNWRSPSTGMEFVWIPQMEMWVGKYEVTNEEYRKKEPEHDSGEKWDIKGKEF